MHGLGLGIGNNRLPYPRNKQQEARTSPFIETIAQALHITLIPFEGLLQSSGWATFVAAFSAALGAEDAVLEIELEKYHCRSARAPGDDYRTLPPDSPSGSVLQPVSRCMNSPLPSPEQQALAAIQNKTPERRSSQVMDTANFSPMKRISSVEEAGKMARAWVEWMEEDAQRNRHSIIIKALNLGINLKKRKVCIVCVFIPSMNLLKLSFRSLPRAHDGQMADSLFLVRSGTCQSLPEEPSAKSFGALPQ